MKSPKAPRFLLGCAVAALALAVTGCATNEPAPTAKPASPVIGTGPAAPMPPAAPAVPPPPPRMQQICNDKPVQLYIGHNTVPSTVEMIRKKAGAYMVRVLGENQPATMDYNQERLNIITNEAGKITALRCG